MSKLVRTLATALFAMYFWGALIAIPYFNWQYARHYGFARWILLGQIVPTAKALVWPYFSLAHNPESTWTDEERQNAMHFMLSGDASAAATKLLNLGPGYTSMSHAEIQEIQRLRRLALAEARLVRDDVLEKVLLGMSKPWRAKHQRGLELQIQAIENDDTSAELLGSALHDEWVDWVNAHRADLRIPR